MPAKSPTTLQETQRLKKLLEVLRTANAILRLDDLLQYVVDAGAELIAAEGCSILLHDADTHHLRFVTVSQGLPTSLIGITVPVADSLIGWTWAHNQPMVSHRAQQDPRHFRALDRHLPHPVASLLAVPMRFQDQTTGVFVAFNKRQGRFSPQDTETLEVLAAQAAAAIYNAQLMQQTHQAYLDLQRLDKMKSDFIAITSHELRTPLGLILGFATYLREVLPKEHHRYVDAIVRNALRLKELIEDLSYLENLQRDTAVIERQPVDLTALLREVRETLLDLAAAHQVTLEPIPQVPLPPLKGDRHKLGVALRQLMKNAILFNRPGGKVWVEIILTPEAVQITVKDTGVGIPPEDLPYIFKRFYQVEDHLTRRNEGLGLGLAIAKAMIEAHEGRIWATSEVGKGSAFTVQLPLESGPTEDKATGERPTGEA